MRGDQNSADVLTKPMDAQTLGRHLKALGFEIAERLAAREVLTRAWAVLPMADEE